MSRPMKYVAAILAGTIIGSVAHGAGEVRVTLELPVRAGIDMQGREKIVATPFIVVRQEGDNAFRGRNIDVQKDFQRYVNKLLRRDTDLEVENIDNLDYPTYDLSMLAEDVDFWTALGERMDADLILTGSLDFDVRDRSGYRLEEYVSPFDGRTYYRQVLVEETGFEFDILMQVYDARTGELLFDDNFKDFKTQDTNVADPVAGMFQNLRALEDRIVGVFAQKTIEATRILLRN